MTSAPKAVVWVDVISSAQQQAKRPSLQQELQAYLDVGYDGVFESGRMDVPLKLASFIQCMKCEVDFIDQGSSTSVSAPMPVGMNSGDGSVSITAKNSDIQLNIYSLCDDEEDIEEIHADGEGDGDDSAAPVVAGIACNLPHRQLDGLWENLYYDHSTKSKLLDYAATAMQFARAGISDKVVSCNRLVLLHGPPGTGKTTFCKALAQKLSIRLRSFYKRSRFLEVNSHSLFSKWFSESGKLVQKLFEKIKDEIEDDKELFYVVLIDEVESVASSRSHGGSDPQDAVRAGNAVLTQLDRLKRYPNVLILTTSNLTHMIDSAFSSRVDLTMYIGPPNLEARYEIIRSQIQELIDRRMLNRQTGPTTNRQSILPFKRLRQRIRAADAHATATNTMEASSVAAACATTSSLPLAVEAIDDPDVKLGLKIQHVASVCECVGGRVMRRLPIRCFSMFHARTHGIGTMEMSVDEYLDLLLLAINEEKREEEEARRQQQQEIGSEIPCSNHSSCVHENENDASAGTSTGTGARAGAPYALPHHSTSSSNGSAERSQVGPTSKQVDPMDEEVTSAR